ncbi:MFS transporter [Amnibacterium kyonggiense]|uniref:EmrB/QacA subfamily drug resistance transporter n=1 Tax=Amnibacterium kyonggiense TaxID=595671 RepID=A0A4R7FSC4_9MICO|nr:MFS transporter [Amnibacterium kyonggiense]TDS80762.1 EmrB/QacA subfamily drug resistance transporter [Amnibacterium kyonggiense]
MRDTEAGGLDRPLAVLMAGAYFMENLDGTIVQTALPAIGRDFGVPAVDANTAITAYLLSVAVSVPLGGWVADRLGTRRVFLVAIVLFAVASLACGLTGDLVALCVLRVVQGVAGAFMVPVGRLAVLRATRQRDLIAAIAYLTWPGLLAPVIAPALGGVLTDTVGWRWVFLMNVPIGAVLLLAGLRLVPRSADRDHRGFDVVGFALLGVGLVSLLAGLEALGGDAPLRPATVLLLAVAMAAIAGAVGWMRRAAHPLLSFRALGIPTFRASNLGGGIYRLVVSALPFLYTLLFQVGFGWSASLAGALVVAVFVGNIGIKPFTTRIIRRFGFRTTIVGSNVAGALLAVAFVPVDASTPLPVIALLLLVGGAFRSIGFTAYNSLQFADVPAGLTSGANTVAATVQQIAIGFGVAVAALAVRSTVAVAEAVAPGADSLGYRWAFAAIAVLLLVPIAETLLLPRHAGAAVAAR